IRVQRLTKELLGATQSICAAQTGAWRRLLENVFITDDAALGIDAHAKLFFLSRAEEARFPIPDGDLCRHEAIGLLQPDLTFHRGLGIVSDVQNDGGVVSLNRDVLSRGEC